MTTVQQNVGFAVLWYLFRQHHCNMSCKERRGEEREREERGEGGVSSSQVSLSDLTVAPMCDVRCRRLGRCARPRLLQQVYVTSPAPSCRLVGGRASATHHVFASLCLFKWDFSIHLTCYSGMLFCPPPQPRPIFPESVLSNLFCGIMDTRCLLKHLSL